MPSITQARPKRSRYSGGRSHSRIPCRLTGAATFTWTGSQTGTATLAATNEIQASSYSALVGCQTENTGDTTGAYDVGYVTNNGYAMYKAVVFGASALSKVTVRTASGGNGGTAEFHLDSVGGPLLGTATLPVTNGYQTYTNVTVPVTGASGTHDVYMVFHGSGGIANVNCFSSNNAGRGVRGIRIIPSDFEDMAPLMIFR